MPKLRRREIYLLAALVGLAAAWLALSPYGEDHGRGSSESVLAAAQLGDPPNIRLESLGAITTAYDPGGRNPFVYRDPQKQQPRVETPPTETARPGRQDSPSTPESPPRLRDPRPAFNYIGFLGPKDHLVAVFRKDAEIFLARIGELVDDSFMLLELRYDSVVLTYVGREYEGRRIRLRMSPS